MRRLVSHNFFLCCNTWFSINWMIYYLTFSAQSILLQVRSQDMKLSIVADSYLTTIKALQIKNECIDKSGSNFTLCSSYTESFRRPIYDAHEHRAHHDTISNTDVVRRQYLSLPYPPVNEDTLEYERVHYMGYYSKQYPFNMYYSLTLENINHFLFEGKTDFR